MFTIRSSKQMLGIKEYEKLKFRGKDRSGAKEIFFFLFRKIQGDKSSPSYIWEITAQKAINKWERYSCHLAFIMQWLAFPFSGRRQPSLH